MCKKTSGSKTSFSDELKEGLLEVSDFQEFILSQPHWLLWSGVALVAIPAILAFSLPLNAVPLGSQAALVVSILLYIGILYTEHHRIDTLQLAPRSWATFTGPLIAMYGLFAYGLVSFLLSYPH